MASTWTCWCWRASLEREEMSTEEWMVGDSQLLPVLCFSSRHRCSPLAAAAGLAFAPCAAVGCGHAGRRCLGRGGSVRSEQPVGGAERCPAWCAVNHDVASDEFDGVVHESAHLPVAGVVFQRGHGDDGGLARRAVPPSSTWCATSTPVRRTSGSTSAMATTGWTSAPRRHSG